MTRPTVHQAHTICDSLRTARAVIVIALDRDGKIAGASYGETKLECRQTAYTLDCIVDAMEAGRIPVWATVESESKRLIDLDAKRVSEGVEEGIYCPHCKLPNADCDCDDDRMTPEQYDEGSDDFM